MNKPYYSDYVEHMMRFYLAHPSIPDEGINDCDRANWDACHETMSNFSFHSSAELGSSYMRAVSSVLSQREPMHLVIPDIARFYQIPPKELWDCVKKFEYALAKERGLLSGNRCDPAGTERA